MRILVGAVALDFDDAVFVGTHEAEIACEFRPNDVIRGFSDLREVAIASGARLAERDPEAQKRAGRRAAKPSE
jgi:hypothetical protein